MACVFWILYIATGEWNVDTSSVRNWKAKLSKLRGKIGVTS